MFPMTVTINNPAQLSAVMAALAVDQIEVKPVAAAPADVAATTEAKATTTKKEKKAEPVVEQAKAEAAPADQPKVEQKDDAPAAVTYQDASKAILKLSAAKGRDTAVALLSKFGAANLKEVKPEQYAAVMAAANEAMGA